MPGHHIKVVYRSLEFTVTSKQIFCIFLLLVPGKRKFPA